MEKQAISKWFLIVLIIFVLYLCYLIFRPFLVILLAAAILSSIFYTPYEQLTKLFRGRKHLASLIICIFVAILVVLPAINIIALAAQKSVVAYDSTVEWVAGNDVGNKIFDSYWWNKINAVGFDQETIKGAILESVGQIKDWLVGGTKSVILGTTNFIFSLIMILFAMFFFFVDGKVMVEKIMRWTPLPNKYDKEIFKKFRDVSRSTVISTFVTAVAQGILGAIGFLIVGLPAFFAAIAIGFFSLMPYIGTAIIWLPVALYLLFTGQIWQGVFLIIWGAVVIGQSDNLLRAYLIKGKAQVHPIFIIFSILGGIAVFGIWGVIFGPLIISLAVTILHIYEMEYESVLEK